MKWVKANGFIFNADEVIAICPIGPATEGGGDADAHAEMRAKVILRAGFEIELRGGAAHRFREMFLEMIAGTIQDHDVTPVQVNETRVLISDVDAARNSGRPS